MKPITNEHCNVMLSDRAGLFPVLPAQAEAGTITTFWMPDADELARLNDGLPLVVQIVGDAHPPIGVGVALPAPQPEPQG